MEFHIIHIKILGDTQFSQKLWWTECFHRLCSAGTNKTNMILLKHLGYRRERRRLESQMIWQDLHFQVKEM